MSSPIAQNAEEETSRLVASVNAVAQHNIGWYQRRKRAARRWYYGSSVTVLVSGALIPALSAVPGEAARAVTAVCGLLVVITTGLSTLFRWHLNWVQYAVAQTQLETLLRQWELDVNQLHASPEDKRLPALRKLCKQFITDAQAVRRAETSATLPEPKAPQDGASPDPAGPNGRG